MVFPKVKDKGSAIWRGNILTRWIAALQHIAHILRTANWIEAAYLLAFNLGNYRRSARFDALDIVVIIPAGRDCCTAHYSNQNVLHRFHQGRITRTSNTMKRYLVPILPILAFPLFTLAAEITVTTATLGFDDKGTPAQAAIVFVPSDDKEGADTALGNFYIDTNFPYESDKKRVFLGAGRFSPVLTCLAPIAGNGRLQLLVHIQQRATCTRIIEFRVNQFHTLYSSEGLPVHVYPLFESGADLAEVWPKRLFLDSENLGRGELIEGQNVVLRRLVWKDDRFEPLYPGTTQLTKRSSE